jgi:hypothetical protein
MHVQKVLKVGGVAADENVRVKNGIERNRQTQRCAHIGVLEIHVEFLDNKLDRSAVAEIADNGEDA